MENMLSTILCINALNVFVNCQFQKQLLLALNIKHIRDLPKYPDDVTTPVSQGAVSHLLCK